ncbi:MAG: serine--tRNA ligase [bacterium]|nr:serine--tRNA ligase [bacterium]
MLDIRFIRENKELIAEATKKKYLAFKIEELLTADDKRREILQSVEGKRGEQNKIAEEVPKEQDKEKRADLIEKSKKAKEELQKEEEKLKEVMKEWQLLMLQVPNIPDMTVPDGADDSGNKEVKKWGVIPKFDFPLKSHIDLMVDLDMVDFDRGTKVAGFRGYFLKNDGALLSYAIWQYGLQFFLQKGFTPMIVPSLVRREQMLGTGFLPQGEDDLYKTQDGDYLAGTAEVASMGFHSGEIIPKEKLPLKYLSFSPCFRREAGSHGRDTKGLIRVHEFFKLEQVVICEADHQESVKWHEWVNRNTEEFIESLEIPYHTVINCGGDLGLGQVKKYDIELWVPGENTYREISSASYFHDFQTRRLDIKYKDAEGKMRFTHSLNSTAIPTPRALVSIVENNQQADGTIKVPKVLVPYMGKEVLG